MSNIDELTLYFFLSNVPYLEPWLNWWFWSGKSEVRTTNQNAPSKDRMHAGARNRELSSRVTNSNGHLLLMKCVSLRSQFLNRPMKLCHLKSAACLHKRCQYLSLHAKQIHIYRKLLVSKKPNCWGIFVQPAFDLFVCIATVWSK